jgi:hypothetical protein
MEWKRASAPHPFVKEVHPPARYKIFRLLLFVVDDGEGI